MKETNFTFLGKKIGVGITFFFAVLMSSWNLSAQSLCALACKSNVQISLNQDCQAVVTADMLLNANTTSCPNGVFVVEVTLNGVVVPGGNVLTVNHIGKPMMARVIDMVSGNSCWSNLIVEDKMPPVWVDTDPEDIYCYELDTYRPEALDNCTSPVTINFTTLTEVDNNCQNGLPVNVIRRITRSYVAVDAYGNTSIPKVVTFNVIRLDSLTQIDFPASLTKNGGNALQCDGAFARFPAGHQFAGHPMPSVTGVPTLFDGVNNVSLFPNNDLLCDLAVSFSDVKINGSGCVEKIMRTWNVIEWSCATVQRTRSFVQVIEIVDNVAPVITPRADMTVSTSPHNCAAVINLPALTATDNCSPTITWTVQGGPNVLFTNGGLTTLQVGQNIITYTASDLCGNRATSTYTVTVEDLTPPVAICDLNTTVSLTTDGQAWVPAESFDDGSYDECQLAKFIVRRMDHTNCQPCGTPEFPGFRFLGTDDGRYYYLSNHAATARVALKTARAMGGYGVSFETRAERTLVRNWVRAIDPTLDYLIGYTDTAVEGTFAWESTSPNTMMVFNNTADRDFAIMNADLNPGLDGEFEAVSGNDSYRYVVEITDPCGFSSYAKFCCEDITNPATPVMVVFRAIDASGNFNECMVNAHVQDKLPPTITCPTDLTVECTTLYDINNLSAAFGDAVANDNCHNTTITRSAVVNIDQCNKGTIVRTFIATDPGGRTAVCTQTITFVDTDPFFVNESNPLDPNDDVIWPADVTVEGCDNPQDFVPNNLPVGSQRPVLLGNQCSLVGADYKDHIFRFNNGQGDACFKIIRKWKIIDWCQVQGLNYRTWEYDQVIKVNNTIDPTITSSCARKTANTFDSNCASGFIELTASATDDCTVELAWTYRVDANNNGTFDITRSGTGNTADASGQYPVGSHRIQWSFTDLCGNVTTCDQLFDIINMKAPTPYCIDGLSSSLMPVDTNNDGQIDNGMLEIWASDFDLGSSHPCGYTVFLSFSPDLDSTSRMFDCSDVGLNPIEIYATVITPQGDTIQSFCSTNFRVTDSNNACQGNQGGRVAVNGTIATELDINVEEAEVFLRSAETMKQMTNNAGTYNFGNMLPGGSYTIDVLKNNDHANGVSTLDLVLIQRHILGLEKLNTPYKVIAADINMDKRVAASDIVSLRKVILGTANEFLPNTSWRFIDKSYTFFDPANPLNEFFPESYDIFGLNSDMKVDFVAVKVGDVNGSAVANAMNVKAEPRTSNTLEIVTKEQSFRKGDDVTVSLDLAQATVLTGAQFTFNFDASKLKFEGIAENAIGVNETNLGLTNLENGVITLSWNNGLGESVDNIANLKFTAIAAGTVASAIMINSDMTKAEAYNDAIEIMPITLRSVSASEGAFALYQNNPNPFASETTISFTLPTESQAKLTVFDVTGKVLFVKDAFYSAGTHQVNVSKQDLRSVGVLYYQLESGTFTATKKMVIIE